ncbi:hypothetical protein JCM10213v2_004616 [Rhodosporidiobolus nylandii]
MARTKHTDAPTDTTSAPPAASSSRKRQRSTPAGDDASSAVAPPASTADDAKDSDGARKKKKSRTDAPAEQQQQQDGMTHDREAGGAAAGTGDSQPSSTSSATLTGSAPAGSPAAAAEGNGEPMDADPSPALPPPAADDEPSKLEGMTAEERRKAKGKGKATRDDQVDGEKMQEGGGEDSELERLRKELAFKDELIAQQLAVLSSVHQSLACNVCLETLDRPYSLGCGHVFCRPCLLNWFFRPDPSAEDAPPPSQSGSDSSSSSSSSSSDSDSGSSRSQIHGHLRGQPFTVTGASAQQADEMFGAASGAAFDLLERAAAGRAPRGRGELGGGAGEGGAGRQQSLLEFAHPAAAPAAETTAEETPLSPGALRAARLARFAGPSDNASSTSPHFPQPATGAPPAAPAAAPPARAPTPPPARGPPPPLPQGAHRAKNLVCPQCRTSCAARAPQRVFQLSEVVATIRRAGVTDDGTLHPGRYATPRPATAAAAAAVLPGEDEADGSWGGLWPGPGGTESARDRRRREARIVRDREDGVRRCGECGWEVNEREGVCEGCGREWAPSSASSSSGSDDDAHNPGGYRAPRLGFARRHAHRTHDDVLFSGESSASDSDGEGSRRRRSRRDDDASSQYESDGGFIVETSDVEREDAGRRARRRERERRAYESSSEEDEDEIVDGTSPQAGPSGSGRSVQELLEQVNRDAEEGEENEETRAELDRALLREAHAQRARNTFLLRRRLAQAASSSEEEEEEEDSSDPEQRDRRRRRERRKRRHEGEVIDSASDTESESESASAGSWSGIEEGSQSGSGADEEEEEEQPASRASKYFGGDSTSAASAPRTGHRSARPEDSSSSSAASSASGGGSGSESEAPAGGSRRNRAGAGSRAQGRRRARAVVIDSDEEEEEEE